MNLLSRLRAKEICHKFPGKKILVIGDLMLDHWVWGKVSRISPEAPVPVVDVEHYSYTPGGAANVVSNLKALGATVDIMGVVGADDAGRRLRTMLRRQGVGTEGIFVQDERPTGMKTRIVANSQQVVRADIELRSSISDEIWEQMFAWLENNKDRFDCVALSDYNKGLLWDEHVGKLLEILKRKPVIAGPKPANVEKFSGTSMITLNAKEAYEATGSDTKTPTGLSTAGAELLRRLNIDAALITLGARGMALFRKGKDMCQVPALASQVYDVSGAGDTVLSIMALCLSSGIDPAEAICLASHAAAVVVRKVGTATVSREELLASMDNSKQASELNPERKILSLPDAVERITRLRESGNPPKVVFTNGCFDILHVGHLRTLLAARSEGDLLVVGLNSDESVRALKGPSRPINNEDERSEMLAALECVDIVVIFSEETPLKVIESLRPDVHVKGGDYNEDQLPEAGLVKSFGGKIVLAKMIPGRSTTALVKKMKEN